MKRKLILNILAAITVILVTTGCSSKVINETNTNGTKETVTSKSFQNISPEDAKALIESDKSVIIVDVRTQEEYESGHIVGSILLPVDTIETEASKVLTNKAAKIIVYCRSGHRSGIAATTLVGLGYTNISNLGGIINWPYETVKGSN